MRFAREGYPIAAVPALAALPAAALWGLAGAGVAALLAAALLLFFRDPERVPEGGDGCVIAPADGRVVAVEDLDEGHAMASEARRRVAIFMSPLDVHVNRSPMGGRVEAVRHRPGRFRAAYSSEASEVNESNTILLQSTEGIRLVVVQIAGWLARRIVCHVGEGSRLARGQRFGLIMFGSRVDVYFPDSVQVSVAPGARVRAGVTVIARAGGPGAWP